MKYVINEKGLIYNRDYHATPYEKSVYSLSDEFKQDNLAGKRLVDDYMLPIYKIVDLTIMKTSDEDFTDLTEIKKIVIDKAKTFANSILSKTDYLEIRQLDPLESNRLTDSEMEAVRAYRRGIRSIYDNFKLSLEAATVYSQCRMILASFIAEVEAYV